MSAQHVIEAVLAVLPRCDDLRHAKRRGHPNPLAGHCYVASEVLFHALGWRAWRPMFVRHEREPHWFLWRRGSAALDDVLDVTAGQFLQPPPYRLARGKGFLTAAPSKRAREMARRAGVVL